MSKFTVIAGASTAIVLAASISSVALAWHPEGKIVKEVQNVTQSGAYVDANDASSAVSVHPGDTVNYRITITNPASPAANSDNDLAKINVSDTLPAGVTLVSGSTNKDFGSTVVVPQNSATGNKSVSYVFTAKVSATAKDGDLICNTASYTGNSAIGDAPRSGQDKACVTVTVPPVTPEIPVTPVTPVTPATPEVSLPSTGLNTALMTGIAALLAGIAYGAVTLIQRRR